MPFSRPANYYELTDSTLLKSTRSIDRVMGHDETPFRLELKDPRCGSQIKHKSNPNYAQVLFIKSHCGVQASSASDSCEQEAAVLSSPPSMSCFLHTSLQGATWLRLLSSYIPMFLFQTFARHTLILVARSLEAFC